MTAILPKRGIWRYSIALILILSVMANLLILVFSDYNYPFPVRIQQKEMSDFPVQSFRIKEKAKYSSHYCRKVAGLPAQCIFSNVRFFNSSLIYYEDPDNRVSFINQAIKYEFPEKFVGLRSGGNYDYLTIVKVQSSVPIDAIYVTSRVSYLLSSLWSENFGHWLIDDLFASFSNSLDLGIRVPNLHYVIKSGCLTNHHAGTKDYKRCTGFWKDSLRFFSAIPPVYLDDNPFDKNSEEYINNQNYTNLYQSTGIYFQNVVMGQQINYIARTTNKMSTHWQYFINDMLHRIGANYLRPVKQKITLLWKQGKRRVIENFDEIVAIAKEFGHEVYVMDPSTLSVEEQIMEMRKTTVLVTVPGGISFIAGFLQPPAVALITDIWSVFENRSVPLEDHVWEALGAFNFYRYNYQINETVFPQGYNNYTELSTRIRAELRLPMSGYIDPALVTDGNKYDMLRNHGNIMMDTNRFRTTLGELLRIAEVNFNLSSSTQ